MLVFCMNRDYMCFVREKYGGNILEIQLFVMEVFTVTNKALELQ